jgi:hypothetical protein
MIKRNSTVKSAVSIGHILLLTGCATCLDLEDQTMGTQFSVGDTISTSDTNIKVEQFQYSSGVWTSSERAQIDNRNYARGSGLDLNARNVNLRPQHAYPVNKIKFNFGELGGNNNININGDFQNVGDLIDLNNSTIGGTQVTVDAVQQGNNWYGTVAVEGDISDFSIGGQELWVDNYCF